MLDPANARRWPHWKSPAWGRLLRIALVLHLGWIFGTCSALLALAEGRQEVQVGSWRASLSVGSEEAGPYTRARVAVGGLLAMTAEESIYLLAAQDSTGESLSGSCTYRVRGEDLPARWWSITVYGPDYFLIPNRFDRYSVSKTSVGLADGRFEFLLSPAEQEQVWVPVREGVSFDLLLRLYNPSPSVVEDVAALRAPTIERLDCA